MNIEETISHITNWIKSYTEESGMKGLVIGISGGIDSALTSVLCAETGLPTLCVDLPIHQAQSHQKRGKEHIEWLKNRYSNVRDITLDLSTTFDTFSNAAKCISDEPSALTLANVRSRLRMTALYYFASLNGYLVVGTGNKIEDFGVGFFTKYGDGGVDISPIADLLKSEVYVLAKTLGVVPSILEAAPSDGLFDEDITDEQQLGASYDELEWAMNVLESSKVPTNLTDREQQVIKIYERLNKANQHKMTPIPVCKIPR